MTFSMWDMNIPVYTVLISQVLTKERDDNVIRVQELEGKISNDEENFNGQLDLKQKVSWTIT